MRPLSMVTLVQERHLSQATVLQEVILVQGDIPSEFLTAKLASQTRSYTKEADTGSGLPSLQQGA